MKRFVSGLLILATLLALSSCGGGGKDSITSSPEGKDPEGKPYSEWMSSGFYKNTQNYEGPEDKKTEYEIIMAKNESELCQIAIRSPEAMKGVSFSIKGAIPDGIKVELFEVRTVKIVKDRWPDGLVPIKDGKTFDIPKDKTTSVAVKLTSESDTPAGESSVTVVMTDKDGKTLSEYKISVSVLDITVPETLGMDCWIAIGRDSLAKYYLGKSRGQELNAEEQAELDRLYKLYYDFLLDYGVSGFELPYDILDPRADAYMSDPRVTVIGIAQGEDLDDAKIRAIYEKLKSNPVWFEKALYYPLDEPTTSAMLDELALRAQRFEEIAPGIRMTSAYYMGFEHSSGVDNTEYLMGVLNVMTPKLCLFEQLGAKYKDRFTDYVSRGNELWTYVCWEPGKPFVNLYVNEQGIDHRLLLIQAYDVGATGFLYWSANQWYDIETGNPWNNMATVPWLTYDVYGDGSLLYPGKDFDIDGPCSSLRLEALRDGFEDVTLLRMAEELLGKKEVDSHVDKVTMSVTMYATKEQTFEDFRSDLLKDMANAK